jgi:Contractile injection system tape measure protein
MSGDAHRVRRLLWRIKLESPEEAFALRARLTRTVRTEILPAIERVFADLPSGDDLIHIERLEVTVRVADTDNLEKATVEAIRAELQARLASFAATPPGAVPPEPETLVRRATARVSRLASLVHYLETGTVPWYAEPASADLAYVRELEETAVSDLNAVLQHLPASPAATAVFLFRLLSLLPDAGWVSVVHAVARLRHRSEEPAVVDAIERIATAPERSSARHARLELAAAIIAGWFATVDAEASQAAAEKPTVSSDSQRLFDRLALPARLAKPINSPRFTFMIPGDDSIASGATEDRHPAASLSDQDRTFGVPVSYAGLILLAPFLSRLFAARNVLHPGEKSLNAEARRRAAALLHFAAAGDNDGHEYELGLIKILLGVPMDQPILFASGILSRGDREAVETLLSDVVEHWRVIRPMSIDALRESFLHRRGLLSDNRGSWHLRVEGAAIDSFLDHLPWSLTTLTMAWLPNPITIDWPRD